MRFFTSSLLSENIMDYSDTLSVRKFYVRDRRQVIALWDIVFPGDPPWNEPARIIERKTPRQRDLFLVGLTDEKVIATVLAGYDGFRGWIYHLAVHPDFRRMGIGRRMMAEAESRLTALGCVKVNLQVRAGNSKVIRFYEKIGYKTEDHTSMGKRF